MNKGLGVFSLLAVMACVVGCGDKPKDAPPPPVDLNPVCPASPGPGGITKDGPGDQDATVFPGRIVKNGPGTLTARLCAGGGYTVDMDGPGNLILRGLNDYSSVTGQKNGEGWVIWVPNDASKPKSPPSIRCLGPGCVREGR
jgi:hypothetical protein